MKLTVTPIVLVPLAGFTLALIIAMVFSVRLLLEHTVRANTTQFLAEPLRYTAREFLKPEQFTQLRASDPVPFEQFAEAVRSERLASIALWTPTEIQVYPNPGLRGAQYSRAEFIAANSGTEQSVLLPGGDFVLYVPVSFSSSPGSPDGIIEARYHASVMPSVVSAPFLLFSFFAAFAITLFFLATTLLLRVFVAEPIDALRERMDAFVKTI